MIPALIAGIALGLVGCAGEAQVRDKLTEAGWKAEPTLSGAESETGDVSPRSCRPLFEMLNRQNGHDDVSGYRHARRRSSYLLVRKWSQGPSGSPGPALADAARSCPRMTMDYGPTELDYSIKVVKGNDADTRVLLTATESGDPVTTMLVAELVDGRRHTLVRVMNPSRLGKADRAAVDLITGR